MRPSDDALHVQLDDLLAWSEDLCAQSQKLLSESWELHARSQNLHARSAELCFLSEAIRARHELDWRVAKRD
jgi:hypothetical protein